MTDNWWAIQQMIEAREREVRINAERRRSWASDARNRRSGPGKKKGLRKALGALLLSWGSELLAEKGCDPLPGCQ